MNKKTKKKNFQEQRMKNMTFFLILITENLKRYLKISN